MISRRNLLGTATAAAPALAGLTALAAAAPEAAAAEAAESGHGGLRVEKTTVEYADRPLGLDAAHPRLSWQLGSDRRDQAQSAYQVRVATSPGRIGAPDVWDSGKVSSRQSVLVPYDGPQLRPRTRYHWAVRVWDGQGRPSPWSEPTWWETGLGTEDQGTAKWIAAPDTVTRGPDLAKADWVWYPEGDPASGAPAGTRYFRGAVTVSGPVRPARLAMVADDGFTAWVNGTEIGGRPPVQENWRHPVVVDITALLHDGANTISVAAVNASQSPAGLLGIVELTEADGVRSLTTSADWKATDAEPSGDWHTPGYDDGAWPAAKVLAPWGGGPWGRVRAAQRPALLRREFRLAAKPVARARLYSTALGLYEAEVNGERVGKDRLAPGWTDYRKRVQYQTYDVTGLLRRGANAIGVILASGWYSGNVAWFGQELYGERPALRAELEVTYADGSTDRVITDARWRGATGPILTADLMAGEQYDARLEAAGWSSPAFDDGLWHSADVVPADTTSAVSVVAQADAPIRVERELAAVRVTEPKPGVHVFDLGQNMVGSVRLRVRGEAGRTVRLRHAEVLDQDGMIYTTNLRTAQATDSYTLKGSGTETYAPRFTFHGFRYVEVTGYPGSPDASAVTGRVMHTAAPFTMSFKTDVPMLNQLHRNITWGQRGNFLSVPTDTPARDERLGWTGDINVFSATAAYTMESARFLAKWLQDLRDGQSDAGAFPDVAPRLGNLGEGTAGWGDAGVTVPWNLYQAYGDRQVLADNFPAMRAWIAYLEKHSSGFLRPAEGYGDWLHVADETPKDVVATAYFAHSARLVAKAARVLGHDPAPYDELAAKVRDAFNRAYVSADGTVKGDTQTAYVLALSMDLLPDSARTRAADRLVELIRSKDGHLSTGFLGTPRLLPTLTAVGRTDVAYRLLEQRTFPSWGYQIERGATTMWERWDSVRPDGSFQDPGMNSFNHYAYGSVGQWMYENITGIGIGDPGFRSIVIRPRPGGDVHEANGRYDSLYGPITTRWTRKDDGALTLDVSVPVNTTAEVWLPAATSRAASGITHDGATFLRLDGGCAVYAVGSGSYRFTAP
ncbi:alpha-L-rhamnosidase [Streptomyces sp. NPDC005970]|uniref:alpha-L-rhamnosidase n=1 Tax=Streptomyces sp. NPDC005970 TaxID=3156723 RepID=UPI0033DE5B79